MIKTLISICCIAVSVTTVSASAATKSMECQRYQITDGKKNPYFRFTVTADFDKGLVAIDLIEPKGGEAEAPLHFETEWKNIWKSSNLLRAVATATAEPTSWADSPVKIVDVDFSKIRMYQLSAGGILDFDEVVSNPWQTECKRRD